MKYLCLKLRAQGHLQAALNECEAALHPAPHAATCHAALVHVFLPTCNSQLVHLSGFAGNWHAMRGDVNNLQVHGYMLQLWHTHCSTRSSHQHSMGMVHDQMLPSDSPARRMGNWPMTPSPSTRSTSDLDASWMRQCLSSSCADSSGWLVPMRS